MPDQHTQPVRLSREEMAKQEIGQTAFARGTDTVIIAGFIALLLLIPAFQFGRILFFNDQDAARFLTQIPESFQDIKRAWTEIDSPVSGGLSVNNAMMKGLAKFEKELEDSCHLSQTARQGLQPILCRLGVGNEKTILGHDGWLFYEPDVSHLTGKGFLKDDVLASKRASGIEPDPLIAIEDLRKQLAKRGIRLVLLPVPVKSAVHPEHLKSGLKSKSVLQNPSYKTFTDKLDPSILQFNAEQVLKAGATSQAQYLKTDTHWHPDAMQSIAMSMSRFLRQHCSLPAANRAQMQTRLIAHEGVGDIAGMLDLPEKQTLYPKEKVTLTQITLGQHHWRPERSSPVLLLGDSFTNIYSLDGMGWGESAGFAEQLSYELGLPVDVISRNDAGAHATRSMLANELARGRDRLAGKKVVIYEFAARELSIGDWQLFDYSLGKPKPSSFYVPKSGKSIIVNGRIASITPAPRPGSVPYKDHVISIHLVDINSQDSRIINQQALVYMQSMVNNQWLPPARYRLGEMVTLKLRDWADVASKYDALNRAETDDEDLLFEAPCWGEPANEK